jgi:Zn-dependent metalloprotease
MTHSSFRRRILGLLFALWGTTAQAFLPSSTTVHPPRPNPRSWARTEIAPSLVKTALQAPDLASGLLRLTAIDQGQRLAGALGTLSAPSTDTPETIARRFIGAHPALFGLPQRRSPGTLRTVSSTKAAGGSHVRLLWTIDEAPLLDSMIDIHMNRQGQVLLANGSLPQLGPIKNHQVLSESQAIAAARRAIGITAERGRPSARAVLLSSESALLRAWEVHLPALEPLGDWVVSINAETGRPLSRRNQLMFFSGTGSAYPHHPLKGGPVTVELHGLTRNDLAGDFCYAVNGQGNPASSTTATYVFPPESRHFNEVNAYYHVNQAHAYFAGFGFDRLNFSLWTTVHFRKNFDNAFYSPKERKMYFGDGDRFNDFAREEAIIYHGYAHGVLNEIVELNYWKESGAMNEGQADYFACSLSNDPVIGEWVCAKNNLPEIRDLRQFRHYPEDIADEVHHDGRIWGSALWGLRSALGPATADRLIFSSFYYLKPGDPTFADGVNSLLAADAAVFDGRHRETITATCAERGLLGSSPVAAVLDGRDLARARAFASLHHPSGERSSR